MVGSRDVVDGRTLAERARWAEGVGFTDVCVHDHLAAQHAPIPLLTAVAMATERLRLCPLVFNNDLRHPAVLAQELASLDVISGGRVVVGLGAGWNEPEYRATGIPFDRPGIRIERIAGIGSTPLGPARRTSASSSSSERVGGERPWSFSCAQRSVSPCVSVGGTKPSMNRIAGSREAATGMIQPAWLAPAMPMRAASISG